MHYVAKKCVDVDPKYDSMLYRCSWRNGGHMYTHFIERRNCKQSKVVICFDQYKIVGWGLRFKDGKKYNIMLFVYKSYRRRKIGTTIYRKLSRGLRKKDIFVYPNSESKLFFKRINIFN